MLRFVVIILVLKSVQFNVVEAYATGSPRCDLESMSAMSSSPQSKPNINWWLEVTPERDVTNTTTSPDLFRISILCSDPGYTFKGFLIFAELMNGTRVGEWLNVAESRARPVSHPDCDQGNTLTHFENDAKSSGLVFHYRSPVPSTQNETIKIRCGIVCTAEEWYVARPVLLRPNMQAASQFLNLTTSAVVNQSVTPAPTLPK